MAAAPSSWAGVLAKAPLNEPTAVRAAPTMTILSRAISLSLSDEAGSNPARIL